MLLCIRSLQSDFFCAINFFFVLTVRYPLKRLTNSEASLRFLCFLHYLLLRHEFVALNPNDIYGNLCWRCRLFRLQLRCTFVVGHIWYCLDSISVWPLPVFSAINCCQIVSHGLSRIQDLTTDLQLNGISLRNLNHLVLRRNIRSLAELILNLPTDMQFQKVVRASCFLQRCLSSRSDVGDAIVCYIYIGATCVRFWNLDALCFPAFLSIV